MTRLRRLIDRPLIRSLRESPGGPGKLLQECLPAALMDTQASLVAAARQRAVELVNPKVVLKPAAASSRGDMADDPTAKLCRKGSLRGLRLQQPVYVQYTTCCGAD